MGCSHSMPAVVATPRSSPLDVENATNAVHTAETSSGVHRAARDSCSSVTNTCARTTTGSGSLPNAAVKSDPATKTTRSSFCFGGGGNGGDGVEAFEAPPQSTRGDRQSTNLSTNLSINGAEATAGALPTARQKKKKTAAAASNHTVATTAAAARVALPSMIPCS